jgi:kynurenine formamidase
MKKWQVVTVKDLENAKPKIQPGDIVLFNTGWHHYFRTNDYVYYSHYPGMYTEAGEWLLAKKVKMRMMNLFLALDSMSFLILIGASR